MAAQTGKELAEEIQQRIAIFKETAQGIAEETSLQAPAGRWSPKEIVSHLLGPEGSGGHVQSLQAFLDRETPFLDFRAADPFYTEARSRTPLERLLGEVEKEYEAVAAFAEGLDPTQLDRRAQIPMLKDSPLGEYPTLEEWLGGIAGHLRFHTDHLREILQALGGNGAKGGK